MSEPEIILIHGDNDNHLEDWEDKIDLIITSPPYNIGPKGDFGRGKGWRGIEDYSDGMDYEQYEYLQMRFLNWANNCLKPNGSIFYNHKLRTVNNEVIHPLRWIDKTGLKLVQEIVWDRNDTHNHDPHYYYPVDERIFWLTDSFYKVGIKERRGRYKSTVWRMPRETRDNTHNAPFPEALAETLILNHTEPGDWVMDPHLGSGTVAAVAKRLQRNCVGIEISEEYYKMAKTRVDAIQPAQKGWR